MKKKLNKSAYKIFFTFFCLFLYLPVLSQTPSPEKQTDYFKEWETKLPLLTNVEDLDMSYQNLSKLPDGFSNLKKLRRIRLDCNPLSQLPPSFISLPSLEEISFQGGMECEHPILLSETMAEQLTQISRLKKLTLGLIANKTLPLSLFKLQHIQELDFSLASLQSLPPEIGKLVTLEKLDLSNTPLLSLPSEIGQLIHLKELTIQTPLFCDFPSSIQQLKKLKTLNLKIDMGEDESPCSEEQKQILKKYLPQAEILF